MRLIDADALIEVFANLIPWCIDTQEEIAFTNGLSSAYEATNNAPTIDAVPVVRCKDCKWHQDNATWEDFINNCKWISIETPDDDDFCSCGERKDDE